MFESVVILRMVERIIAVLIGGLAIYLGYRLFFHLPFVRDNEGQIELPGVKVVLSRVGPGVFFAFFGTTVLFYSFTNPVSIEPANAQTGGGFVGFGDRHSAAADVTEQQRSRALNSIEMLNCAERLLDYGESDPYLDEDLKLALRDAKTAVLLSVWNEADWGPSENLGVAGPTQDAPFQLRSRFIAAYEDCPK